MADKIEKVLRTLSPKERAKLQALLLAIKEGKLDGIDIVKLKGHQDIYRARKGDMRIIYCRIHTAIIILSLERRSETTYKHA